MLKFMSLNFKRENLITFFLLFFVAIFTVGSCNDNNGGIDDLDTSACTVSSDPCSNFIPTDTTIECVLTDTTCVVNLDEVISILQQRNFNVTDSSILYIGAWGGNGGSAAENGGATSPGGYTQTTTSVSDIVNRNNGSSLLYYFLGEPGGNAPGHCGGGGGASTIVTFEDLTLNPGAEPSSGLLIMISGGGGGGGGGTIKNCTNPTGTGGGRGGITIAPESPTPGLFYNAGAGCNGTTEGCGGEACSQQCPGREADGVAIAEGGGGSQGAPGGQRMCCIDNQTGPIDGLSGIGGFGGAGGQGVSCTKVQAVGFRNASLSFSAGQGGFGGGGTNKCTSGGGGGGGGYGGGGGGGHGGPDTRAQGGGGGGSTAFSSTQDTSSSPTTRPTTNPCGTSGCVTITFFDD